MTKTKEQKVKTTPTIKERVDYAVFKNAVLKRSDIKEWLTNDIKSVYILLSEILKTDECIEALAEVFYQRYVDFHKKKAQEPELDLKVSKAKDEENE